ncbi:MAG: HD domain-containing protein [Mariniphaga sp.]|nr:HD domain-containing protein [Mariniphaga sp.]MDD4754833.1 HD domain-containing protein [Prolixibacteraceae bacterium]
MSELIVNAQNYVSGLLEKLKYDLVFHNMNHTYEVVEAAKEIALHSNLSDRDLHILVTAAWFHDCGYSKVYKGHEEASIKIAEVFLKAQGCGQDFIVAVSDCIRATKFPQFPQSNMEEILCDADLYHFARPNYPKYEAAIRCEFDVFMGKVYSDEEWKEFNCKTLSAHTYFTEYGKKVLTKFKEVNLFFLGCTPK